MKFEKKIRKLVSHKNYVPVTAKEMARNMDLRGRQHTLLEREVERMLNEGKLVKIKNGRLCAPLDADLITGQILFRSNGKAIVIPEAVKGLKQPDKIAIRAEDTYVSFHKDRVVVRLRRPRKPKKQRRRKSKLQSFADDSKKQLEGEVIRILKRARTTLTGTLQRSHNYYFVVPDDPSIVHDIIVLPPKESKVTPLPKVDDKVVVELDEWTKRFRNPEGKIIEVLGKTHNPKTEHKALLLQYELNPTFTEEILNEVSKIPQKVQARQIRGRKDFRKTLTMTIDPDDSRDFDDALSLEHLDDGKLRIGVHIADVSAYVSPNTPLDKEARERGNSTYLVDEVIPMFPHELSNGICSLVEAQDRLTKSVIFTCSPKGKILETEFQETVICSDKRLTYKQALALLSNARPEQILKRARKVPRNQARSYAGKPLDDIEDTQLLTFSNALKALWSVASRWREQRMRSGCIDLNIPEIKIFTDRKGSVTHVEKIENDISHQLIEEFMLAANEAVSRRLTQEDIPLIHRVHDKPDPERLDELRDYLETFNVRTGDLNQRSEMKKFLKLTEKHPQGYNLRIEFLRSLSKACYRSTVDGHFGLNKKYYVHFTSPIRRYADLVCHRMLHYFLTRTNRDTKKSTPYKLSNLSKIAEHISQTEVNSKEAERTSNKVKLLEFFEKELAKKQKTPFDAIIVDVKNFGLFVELPNFLSYGFIPLSSMNDDLYSITSNGNAIVGRRRKRKFSLGDTIQVNIANVDRYKRILDFRIA